METQDLKKQLLNVIGPVNFSETPIEVLQKFAAQETDETLRRYFLALLSKITSNAFAAPEIKKLQEAEHDLLCWLIQIYFNEETKLIFKRYLIVVYLFPEYVKDMKLLLSILNYYDIFKQKI